MRSSFFYHRPHPLDVRCLYAIGVRSSIFAQNSCARASSFGATEKGGHMLSSFCLYSLCKAAAGIVGEGVVLVAGPSADGNGTEKTLT